MVIVDVVDEQVPADVIDHSKTFIPNPKLVTVELAATLFVIVPDPDITDQVPIPVVGVLPASVAELVVIQTV